ncbi:hypothetical protein CEXT_122771 [Caerostris extrusa]|uniref:Uncharacterized protein n=1 Tax=Caerostris extrusa TaxID=172846 RepID=A0AAV4V0Z7_CAEEX|nr:hypothetical protein CEXT_122771 [Caerostris extrusa]
MKRDIVARKPQSIKMRSFDDFGNSSPNSSLMMLPWYSPELICDDGVWYGSMLSFQGVTIKCRMPGGSCAIGKEEDIIGEPQGIMSSGEMDDLAWTRRRILKFREGGRPGLGSDGNSDSNETG